MKWFTLCLILLAACASFGTGQGVTYDPYEPPVKRLTDQQLDSLVDAVHSATLEDLERTLRPFYDSLAMKFGRLLECDVDALQKQLTDKPPQLVPWVGLDACELLASTGAPDRTNLQQSEYGNSMSWWYETNRETYLVRSETHLVRLEYRPSARKGSPVCDVCGARWIVTYVDW